MEIQSIRRNYEIAEIVRLVTIANLKKFRPVKGADSKTLYDKRLGIYMNELLEALIPINKTDSDEW